MNLANHPKSGGPNSSNELSPGIDFDLTEYVAKLRRHWLLLLLILGVCLSVAAIRYSMTPKQYQAVARLQIERRSLTSVFGSSSPWLENWWSLEYYPTQYKLLESRGLAERVARQRMIVDEEWGRTVRGQNATDTTEAGNSGLAASDDQLIARLGQGLRGRLSVVPIRKTQLVDLIYRSSDPEEAAMLANLFASQFIEMGIESTSQSVGKTSEFVDDQVAKLRQDIATKESELQSLSRSSNIVAGEKSNVTLQRLGNLTSEYTSAQANRIEKESRYRELQTSPPDSLADSLGSSLVGELRKELLRKEREYETNRQNLLEGHWDMVALKADIEKSRRDYEGALQEALATERQTAYAAYQTALRQEQSMLSQLNSIKSTAIDEQSATAEYGGLQTEIQNLRSELGEMLQRQSETSAAMVLQKNRESNVRIIDTALAPGAPILPSLRRSLSMGMVMGLMLGVGCVVLLEYLDRTIKTAEEAERLLSLPTLGVIPDIALTGKTYSLYGLYGANGKGERSKARVKRSERKANEKQNSSIELLPHNQPRLAISEAYRALRTGLLLSSAEELRLITVTSAESGEGKSTTATNLAVVMAQLGQRILLIDADLRKPRLHQIFGISNRFGLVNLLTGGAEPDQIYTKTAIPNLFLIPTGPIPPNPAELLASQRMKSVLEHVREAFDMVIVDTTPTLAVTDATLVGSRSDGVLLCLRAGKVVREDAKACRDRLVMADVKILGMVLNRYSAKQGRYSRRYHTYETYGESYGEPLANAEDPAA